MNVFFAQDCNDSWLAIPQYAADVCWLHNGMVFPRLINGFHGYFMFHSFIRSCNNGGLNVGLVLGQEWQKHKC